MFKILVSNKIRCVKLGLDMNSAIAVYSWELLPEMKYTVIIDLTEGCHLLCRKQHKLAPNTAYK